MSGVEPNPQSRVAWLEGTLDRFQGSLMRYAARITGDVDLARDVVQETFLRLCSQNRAEVDGHLAQWLYAVCRNRAMDVRRKERRMRTLGEIEVQPAGAPDCGPATAAENRDGASRVLGLLALLPQNQQEVIRLRFQSGLSYKDIAGVTGLSVSNVGYLIHVAVKALREKLGLEEGT